ncbi:MAG: hypothetical protein HOY71_23225, partial [Nonomuraea sp.]|nr:hypothetical protein [Nonomuraea sp.]
MIWNEVRDLITSRKPAELTARLLRLTDAERTDVGARLPGLLTELRDEVRAEHPGDDLEVRWAVTDRLESLAGPLLIAGAATIS